MPRVKEDFFELHPYRVGVLKKVFEPGEFNPHVPQEYPEGTDAETIERLEKRGETQIVIGISEIQIDVAKNPANPEWVPTESAVSEYDEAVKAYRAAQAEAAEADAEKIVYNDEGKEL